MTPSIIQTQFLKRYIDTEAHSVPAAGPFAAVGVLNTWFETVGDNPLTLKITKYGIRAFWAGVKKHGHKAVMGKTQNTPAPNNTPPEGGSPACIAA